MVANEAFNRHDFEGAFFGFHPHLEWHTVAHLPDRKVFHGRSAVIAGFRELIEEFPDWRVEPQEFIDGGDDAILVRNVATASARASGVPVRQPFTQVWTFSEGRPVEVREYLDHSQALAAVAGRAGRGQSE